MVEAVAVAEDIDTENATRYYSYRVIILQQAITVGIILNKKVDFRKVKVSVIYVF